MTPLQAIVLGILQGLSEFLPISSSAHLTLAPWLLGWEDPGLAFDVALHFGTLLAVLWYFRMEWLALIKAAFGIVTTGRIETPEKRRVIYLIIATIPGVSRSGSTITTARGLRFDREAAAEFSFLMSMPIIAAAVILEGPKALQQGGFSNELMSGIVASAISGWLAISILMRYVSRHSYGIFAAYRILLGIAVLAVVYARG